ncbi:MAG: hypothetical protein LUD51_05310 [Clostridia bacterium]|nr:hypothetical protein [Clostridia bacterium]
MSKKQVVVKKKGFSVVSLLIGLLIGIIIMAAAIGGLVAYLVFGDIDTILSIFGLENQDDDGNYVYVNTDTENGGVSSVMDLINWVSDLGGISELSVAEISAKLPVVETYVDVVYDALADYGLELDRDEVNALPFSEFTDYISDKVMDIQLGALLDAVGVSESSAFGSNVIVKAMIYGVEAPYVYVNKVGNEWEHRYPVWYDEYYLYDASSGSGDAEAGNGDEGEGVYSIATAASTAEDLDLSENSGKYLINRTDGSTLSGEDIGKYAKYLTLSADGYYRIYYCGFPATDEDGNYTETAYYVTYKDPDTAEYVWMDPSLEYTTSSPTLHGNYYFDEDHNDVEANPITIRKLVDNPYENLYEIYITDLYENNTEDLGFIADVLGNVSLAELINGEVDFQEIVDNLELSSIMTVTYDPGSVSSAESILLYLLYGVSDIQATETTNLYTGLYRGIDGDEVECWIQTDSEGSILGVYIYDDDTQSYAEAPGTTISQVDVRMNGLMDDLTISEIVDVSAINNPIIDMIAGSTINGFASDINHMTMNQLFCNDIYGKSVVGTDSLEATLYEVVENTDAVADEDAQTAFNSEYTYFIEGNSGILIPVGEGYSTEGGTVTYGNGHYDSYSDLKAAMGDTAVYTYGQARSLWKLLIYQTVTETDPNTGSTSIKKDDSGHAIMYEVAYLVSDMNSMYYNIQYNVQNANLATLQDALMLDISDDFLDSYLYTISSGSLTQSDKQVRDMTLIELLNYIQDNFTYTQQ